MKPYHGIILPSHQALIDAAFEFALKAHDGQLRKYTNEPYINHPIEVAQIVSGVTSDHECICAAFLHDVIEDCGVTNEDLIGAGFGEEIIDLVWQLTDVSKPEDGNRANRKALDREHIANASPKAKTVKLADLLSNTRSIVKHDADFAKVYMAEKKLLLEVLKEGHPSLYFRASLFVSAYYL